jgi:PBP4 family serine-type D-alanyl-D-alanine carboxypeptidase
MKKLRSCSTVVALCFSFCGLIWAADGASQSASGQVPSAIQVVFDKPLYKGATWGLRVLDSNGKVLIDYNSQQNFFIGSVRKVFSVGQLLNKVGPDHTWDTPVYRVGNVDSAGVLHGNLVLVAAGDLTMGGRTNPNGSIAITDFDHNEADSLGNAELTAPDPTAGYTQLAQQVAAAGIKKVAGDVIVDDRLFQPFDFRGQFKVTPIFVNDDVVDLTINPAKPGSPASVVWRPTSAALGVDSKLLTSAAGSGYGLKLEPEFPQCIGTPGCKAAVTGNLPMNYTPHFTNKFPLVQVFRIVNPTNYARTVFVEKLQAAGVSVDAPAVKQNAASLLPARGSYDAAAVVANLKGMEYSDYARFILKVSYNIGADTSLVLFGLANNVDNMTDALAVEQKNLASNYGVPADQYHFVDGSGGGPTTATNVAVTQMLMALGQRRTFPFFINSLPIMGFDGSLGFINQFESDPTLAGAKGQVRAKPGTYAEGSATGLMIKGQAFGGYIDTKSGQRLIYQLVVNNVPVSQLMDLLQIFQDQGTISAILWRDN